MANRRSTGSSCTPCSWYTRHHFSRDSQDLWDAPWVAGRLGPYLPQAAVSRSRSAPPTEMARLSAQGTQPASSTTKMPSLLDPSKAGMPILPRAQTASAPAVYRSEEHTSELQS